jgi:hypothetical protein
MKMAWINRLSPWRRGEDKGEGFERIRAGLTLTLHLSLEKGEATQHPHRHSKTSLQT